MVNGSPNRNYTPGDTLTYKVKVGSNRGYLNNHRVFEDIKGIQVLLSNGEKGNPFNGQFTVRVEKEDSNGGKGTTDGTLDGTVADNQNIDTTIDVAGDDYTQFIVEGVVRNDAAGDITIGDDTVSPYDYHIKFSKLVDPKTYQPGKPLVYHLKIENDSKGIAYRVPIVDQLSSVQVELLDGTTGPAFPEGWTIEPKVLGGNTATVVDFDASLADNQDIDIHASIPAGETIDYVVTANVNANAVGEIVNLLKVDGDTVSAKSFPDTDKYSFEKHITKFFDKDGVAELSGGYTPGGYIEYQIKLENKSFAHLKDIAITDEISSITTDYFDGTKGQAFDSWTIKTQMDSSGLTDAGTVSDNTNIDTKFDLASESFAAGGTFIVYTIKAKVSEKAVGSIQNVAYIEQHHKVPSERADMLPAKLKKIHKAYTDTSFTTIKKTYNHSDSGQKVVYHLRLENSGKGTEYGASLTDTISSIESRLAQDAEGESNSQTGAVYQPSGWTVTVTKTDELVTQISEFKSGSNLDIDIPNLSIAAGGWVDFVIEGRIRADALENVVSRPKYSGKAFSQSTIVPDAQNVEVSKRIVSIGGRTYSDGDTYKPGEEVVYQLDVVNRAKVWADQTAIRDLVSSVKVEVIGGARNPLMSLIK